MLGFIDEHFPFCDNCDDWGCEFCESLSANDLNMEDETKVEEIAEVAEGVEETTESVEDAAEETASEEAPQ